MFVEIVGVWKYFLASNLIEMWVRQSAVLLAEADSLLTFNIVMCSCNFCFSHTLFQYTASL